METFRRMKSAFSKNLVNGGKFENDFYMTNTFKILLYYEKAQKVKVITIIVFFFVCIINAKNDIINVNLVYMHSFVSSIETKIVIFCFNSQDSPQPILTERTNFYEFETFKYK